MDLASANQCVWATEGCRKKGPDGGRSRQTSETASARTTVSSTWFQDDDPYYTGDGELYRM